MRSNASPHHLHVPVFRVFHAPHLGWHQVAHPFRAALVTAAVTATIGVTGLAFESAREAYARATRPPATSLEIPRRPLGPEWRFSRARVDTRSMYRRGAAFQRIDHAWRRR